ncbi:MAG: hypothetical protein ACLRFO_00415 [Alphaproteobacteria bacterium]
MKKILTVSLFAIMAVSAANAEIASTTYVTDRTGDTAFSGSVAGSADLTAAVNALATKVDTVAGNGEGSVAEQITSALADADASKFSESVQGSLSEADSAVQASEVVTGSANGTISVQGEDVAVKGLGSAAYKNVDAFDAAGAATDAVAALDSSKEAASGSVVTGLTITDGKVTALNEMTLDTGINEANKTSANAPTTSAVYTFVGEQIDAFSENTFAGVESRVEEAEEAIQAIEGSAYATSGVNAEVVAEAQSAVQASEVVTGSADGTISVQGTDVAVKGLGSAAYKNVDAFDAAGAATNAVAALDSSVNAEAGKVITGLTVVDGKITASEKMALTALANFPVECNGSDTHCALAIDGGTLKWEVVK